MRIIYLGWGSLLWNYDKLAVKPDKRGKIWKRTKLKLPLEFSRISDSKRGRITLVIDEKNGTLNNVWQAESSLSNMNNAIRSLKLRERTITKNISYINLKTDKYRINNTSKKNLNKIKKWAINQNIDGVIWTDLSHNWEQIKKTKYNIKDVYKYYSNSKRSIRCKILEYIFLSREIANISTPFMKYFFLILTKPKLTEVE